MSNITLKYGRPLTPPANLVELDGDERSRFFRILSFQPELMMRDILESGFSLWLHCDNEWVVYLLSLIIPATLLEDRWNHPILDEIIIDINSAITDEGVIENRFLNRWKDVDEALWVKLYFWLNYSSRYFYLEGAKEASRNLRKLSTLLDFNLNIEAD